MKADFVYESIVALIVEHAETSEHASREAERDFARKVIENPAGYANCCIPFYAAAAAMLQSCREEIDKKTVSSSSELAALKRIYTGGVNKDCFIGKRVNDAGKMCIVNGFIYLELSHVVESIPDAPEAFRPGSEMLANAKSKNSECKNAPSIADCKAHLAEQKALHGGKKKSYKPMQLGNSGVWCSAELLRDLLTVIPGAKIFTGSPLENIYLENDNGDSAILCPVRPPKATEAAASSAA